MHFVLRQRIYKWENRNSSLLDHEVPASRRGEADGEDGEGSNPTNPSLRPDHRRWLVWTALQPSASSPYSDGDGQAPTHCGFTGNQSPRSCRIYGYSAATPRTRVHRAPQFVIDAVFIFNSFVFAYNVSWQWKWHWALAGSLFLHTNRATRDISLPDKKIRRKKKIAPTFSVVWKWNYFAPKWK